MKKILAGIFVSLMIAAAASGGWCQEKAPLPTVARVIDGDTIELSNGETVRLIGIDCEENEYSPAEAVYLNQGKKWKRAPGSLEQAKASAEFTRKLVEGKKVRLEFDEQKKDQNGRTLAYVWYTTEVMSHERPIPGVPQPWKKRPVEAMLNGEIINFGYAQAITVPPNVMHEDLLVKLENEAREKKRGLWK